MPRRSNAFQKVAFIVHQSLEPEWTVTESDMLPDLFTGTHREVDITARRLVAGQQIILAIECRDHSRAADVSWIEQMHAKHQLLATSKLALWSRSGFTSEAVKKAKLHKIDVVSQTLDGLPEWSRLAAQLSDGYLQLVTPRLSPFVDVRLPIGFLERYLDVATWLFYDSDGKIVGSISALVEQILHNDVMRSTFLDHAPLGTGDFYVELTPPDEWFAEVPKHGRCPTTRIGVGVSTYGERSAMSSTSVHQDNRVVTLATAPLKHGTLELLLEESECGQVRTRVVVRQAGA